MHPRCQECDIDMIKMKPDYGYVCPKCGQTEFSLQYDPKELRHRIVKFLNNFDNLLSSIDLLKLIVKVVK